MDTTTVSLLIRLAVTVAGIIEERTSSKAMSAMLGGRRIEARFDLSIERLWFVLLDDGRAIDLDVYLEFEKLLNIDDLDGDIRWILDIADDAVLIAADYLEAERVAVEEQRCIAFA